MKNMKNIKLVTAIITLCSVLASVNGQGCFNGQTRNCGTFCCPPLEPSESHDPNGFQRTECCTALSARSGCCSIQELQSTTCTSGMTCPGNSGLDDVGEIRNQCCVYFRSGCCSRVENRDLETLFFVTIGLVVGLTVVIIATIFLAVLCCCCVCN